MRLLFEDLTWITPVRGSIEYAMWEICHCQINELFSEHFNVAIDI